jgi:hypothetical protein
LLQVPSGINRHGNQFNVETSGPSSFFESIGCNIKGGKGTKRSEGKITDRIKDEKLNEIETCVCVLDSELLV